MNTKREVSLSWKTDKVTGIKRASVSFEVGSEAVDFALTDSSFTPFIRSYIESMQDKLARSLIEAGKSVIQVMNSLDHEAMLEYMVSEETSGRMTKEKISSWFDSEVSELLMVALADAIGVSDTPTEVETEKLAKAIQAHKDKIVALAGGATTYAPKIAAQLQKALELVDSSDSIGSKFIARLEKMQKQDDAEMLGL